MINHLPHIYHLTKNNNNYLETSINYQNFFNHIPPYHFQKQNPSLISYTPPTHNRTIKINGYPQQLKFIDPLFITLVAPINQTNYYLYAFYFYQNKNEIENQIDQINHGESCMPAYSYQQIYHSPKETFQNAYNDFLHSIFNFGNKSPNKIAHTLPRPGLRISDKMPSHHDMIFSLENQKKHL